MKTTLILCFCFLFNILNAQDKCPLENLYNTTFLGDGKDSMQLRLPLFFVIRTDSIIVSLDSSGKNQFLSFRIMNKECFWNADFTEGKSIYKLMLGDIKGIKFPTLIINGNKEQPVYIELLYENAEKRVFTQ